MDGDAFSWRTKLPDEELRWLQHEGHHEHEIEWSQSAKCRLFPWTTLRVKFPPRRSKKERHNA